MKGWILETIGEACTEAFLQAGKIAVLEMPGGMFFVTNAKNVDVLLKHGYKKAPINDWLKGMGSKK